MSVAFVAQGPAPLGVVLHLGNTAGSLGDGIYALPVASLWGQRPLPSSANAVTRDSLARGWPICGSGVDEYLEAGAVGHVLVSGWDALEIGGGVEDLPGLDGAVEDVGHQLLGVGADRRRPAGQPGGVAGG